MTAAVQQLLESFDRLSRAEQIVAIKEFQVRVRTPSIDEDDLDFTPLTDEQLAQLADELFQMSDAEEACRNFS
ncbi:MAG TPA: hypothetical protein VNH11_03870 [Pirellulales bacterium]|nr:hypothetical protein [Pirellulales bacterium]